MPAGSCIALSSASELRSTQSPAGPDRGTSRLKALRDIASLVNVGSDLPTILQRVVTAVCQHTAWSMGGIMKVDLEAGFSELVARRTSTWPWA